MSMEVNLSTVLASMAIAKDTSGIQTLRKQEKALFNNTRQSVRALDRDSSRQGIQEVFNRVNADIQLYTSQSPALKSVVEKLQQEDTAKSNRVSRFVQKQLRQDCPLFPSEYTREMRLGSRSLDSHAAKLRTLLQDVEAKKAALESKNAALTGRTLELPCKKGAVARLPWDLLKANAMTAFSGTKIVVSGNEVTGFAPIMNALVSFAEMDNKETAARIQMFSDENTPIAVDGECNELRFLQFATTQACSMLTEGLSAHTALYKGVVPVGKQAFDSVHFSKEENGSFTIVAETTIGIARKAGEAPYAQVTACMQTQNVGSDVRTTFIIKNVQANMNATRQDLENLDRAFTTKKSSNTVSSVATA